jgi:hypothetical protein
MSSPSSFAAGPDVGANTRSTTTGGGEGGGSGYGWLVFAGIILVIAGVLNTIYGIAAISDSKFFVHGTKYVFGSLNTWGWVALIIGVVQVTAAFSLWAGNTYGRVIGIAVAGLSAIAALLSIPAYPFLSLAVFAIDILIIFGLASYIRPSTAFN